MLSKIKKILKEILKLLRLSLFYNPEKDVKQIPQEILPFPQAGKQAVKLNIGGGKNHPAFEGWKIVDLRERTADYVVDIAKEKLPFDENSVDVIFTSHTLEHIYPQCLQFVLGEFYRVLKPGTGLLRISLPDIRKAVTAYMEKDYSFFARSSISSFNESVPLGGILSSWFYSTRVFDDPNLRHGDGHVHAFDADYLIWWVRQAGFRHTWESAFKQSLLKDLRQDGFDSYENDSLFVEAVK